jgi:ABC-2 type transport system permease protein
VSGGAIVTQVLWRRRWSTLWWLAGLVGFAALLALAYPTVRGNAQLAQTFAGLPPGVQAALGLDPGSSLTAPIGYLNSQYFANVLPAVYLIFAIGLAAWAIAGDEAAGTLELVLANPISRARLLLERAAALTVLLGVLTAGSVGALALLAPPFGLAHGLGVGHMAAATVASALLALTFAAVALLIGAATGRRSWAISLSSALAVAGFVIQGLAAQVKVLQPVRAVSPWEWALGTDPLRHGLTWESALLPLVVSALLFAAAVPAFKRRDLNP